MVNALKKETESHNMKYTRKAVFAASSPAAAINQFDTLTRWPRQIAEIQLLLRCFLHPAILEAHSGSLSDPTQQTASQATGLVCQPDRCPKSDHLA